MSLFKAFTLEIDFDWDYQDLKDDFLDIIYGIQETKEVTKQDVIALLAVYGTFGTLYMADVAATLDDLPEIKDNMKFMNSYIAEAVSKAGLHYFEAEQGYSIVDKVVQEALDNNGVVTVEAIESFIDEVEASYQEEEIE